MMMALSIMNAVRCIRPDTVLLYWLMQYDVGCLYAILVLNRMSVYHTSNSSSLKENVSLVVRVARHFSTLLLKRLARLITLLVFNLSQTTCTMQPTRALMNWKSWICCGWFFVRRQDHPMPILDLSMHHLCHKTETMNLIIRNMHLVVIKESITYDAQCVYAFVTWHQIDC
jgi:hypothetical protein